MISKIRRRFMATALVAVAMVLAIMVFGMSLFGYVKMVKMLDTALETGETNYSMYEPDTVVKEDQDYMYLLPFWIAEYDTEKQKVSLLYTTDPDQKDSLTELSEQIGLSARDRGFCEGYRYYKKETGEGEQIFALNGSVHLAQFHNLIWLQILAVAIGFFLFYLILLKMSKWMIRPYLQAYESQKRFITNISHDLKTPLTVIRADADVLKWKDKDDRWVNDIQKQAAKMSHLIEEMLFLSRMHETGNNLVWVDFPISDIVEEEAGLYEQIAEVKHRNYSYDIQPMLTYCGDARAIRHMTGVLLDNAIKYSQEEGTVRLELRKKRDGIILTVYNTTEYISRSEIPKLTERFYRIDTARNVESDSHGIGLALAEEIVRAHHGEMILSTEDEKSFLVTIRL